MTFLALVCISLLIKIASAKPHVYDKKACKQITEKRQGDPVLFESVKMGVFSEKAYFASCLFNMYTEQTQDKLLYLVGLYVAANKYFVTDPRFAGEKVVKPEFFKKFPSPEVSDLDPHLKKACETNATACISAVYNHGAGKSGTIQQFLNWNVTITAWSPFKSEYDAFVFRITAMYYLCWYTMKRDPAMMFRFKQPPDFFKTDPKLRHDIDITCLGYLYETKEIPQTERARILATKDKTKISDYRSTYENMKASPFQCAELWFCPDPCYPREDSGGFNPTEDLKQAGNPCRELKNPQCEVVPEANVNFRDLVSNRFNVSCDCESSKKGYFWRSRDNNCEDINECEDQSVCPLGKHCVNTEGGYQCICPTGTTENPRTTKCEVVVSKTPVSKVAPRQNPSSSVDTIAYPADSSGFEDSGSPIDFFEGLANRRENIDKSSSDINNPRQTQTEARTDGGRSTYIRPSENAETETNYETATDSEQEPSFETRTANPNSAFKSPKQHHERKQQPEVINYDIHSSKGKVVSQTDRKHRQQKSEQDEDETVTDGEQGEIEDSETFLSGFVGFVSSGNRVTTSWLFVFGQVSLILCQREVVNLF